MDKLPTPTPNLTQSLGPQERASHRAAIGVAVEVILNGYWKDRPGDEMRTMILIDWMDELQDWTVDQINFALRKWRATNPSKKPNPAHISTILKLERGHAWVSQKEGKPARELFKVEGAAKLLAAE